MLSQIKCGHDTRAETDQGTFPISSWMMQPGFGEQENVFVGRWAESSNVCKFRDRVWTYSILYNSALACTVVVVAVKWERMSVLCSSSVCAHWEEEDRTMQGARHWRATFSNCEEDTSRGANLYKIRLPDLILKCEMVQCDETAAIPSASPDSLPLQ